EAELVDDEFTQCAGVRVGQLAPEVVQPRALNKLSIVEAIVAAPDAKTFDRDCSVAVGLLFKSTACSMFPYPWWPGLYLPRRCYPRARHPCALSLPQFDRRLDGASAVLAGRAYGWVEGGKFFAGCGSEARKAFEFFIDGRMPLRSGPLVRERFTVLAVSKNSES